MVTAGGEDVVELRQELRKETFEKVLGNQVKRTEDVPADLRPGTNRGGEVCGKCFIRVIRSVER